MAKQKGRLMLIQVGNGDDPLTFSNLCGLRSKTLTINNNEIDVTTASCADPGGELWTEVMEGTKRVQVSGNGFFDESVTEKAFAEKALSPSPIEDFSIVVPGLGAFTGKFLISSYEFGGEMEGGVSSSFSLASSGIVTFTAV